MSAQHTKTKTNLRKSDKPAQPSQSQQHTKTLQQSYHKNNIRKQKGCIKSTKTNKQNRALIINCNRKA